jgi:hypothetical protein
MMDCGMFSTAAERHGIERCSKPAHNDRLQQRAPISEPGRRRNEKTPPWGAGFPADSDGVRAGSAVSQKVEKTKSNSADLTEYIR